MENRIDGNVKAVAAEDESSHVLGLKWNYQFDTLVVNRETSLDRNRTPTQRVVLSLVVYGPIGLVALYTVKTRLLLKDIWRLSGQQSNDNLLDHMAEKFPEWSDELARLSEITIPRSYLDGQLEKVKLHIFATARKRFSRQWFSCEENRTGEVYSKTEFAFVFGKAQVAPMKPLTIPKLELQAALLCARLKNEIQLALTIPVELTFMWTYSSAVPRWLQTTDKLPISVANRSAEILQLATTDEWNHVRTSESPDDAGARGFPANALLESYWLRSPDFLKTDEWLFQPSTDVLLKIEKIESKSEQVPSEPEKQEATAITAKVANIASTFEWRKYSSCEKLVRIGAYMLRLKPKSACNGTEAELIIGPAEVEVAQQNFFLLV